MIAPLIVTAVSVDPMVNMANSRTAQVRPVDVGTKLFTRNSAAGFALDTDANRLTDLLANR